MDTGSDVDFVKLGSAGLKRGCNVVSDYIKTGEANTKVRNKARTRRDDFWMCGQKDRVIFGGRVFVDRPLQRDF